MTEDEMLGWHHRCNGCEFQQTPGDSEGQGSLVCCSPWDRKESNTTERLALSLSHFPFTLLFLLFSYCKIYLYCMVTGLEN